MRRTSRSYRTLLLVVVGALTGLGAVLLGQSAARQVPRSSIEQRMSRMGSAAVLVRRGTGSLPDRAAFVRALAKAFKADICPPEPDCESDLQEDGPINTQSEVSVAVDGTGQHVVIGFNDFRGFPLNPVSLSGYMYSDDGGQTFVDGGQLPSPGDQLVGSLKLPFVWGDPDVEYVGACTFLYSSILIKKFSDTATVQTMGVHRSTDCGHTWEGPFEVTPATNPNGGIDPDTGTPLDDADKEYLAVDRETGRVLLSWTNFTTIGTTFGEISTTYSDNILATPPTWSSRTIVGGSSGDGQASNPAFASGSNAYLVWTRYPFPGTFFGYGQTIAFARSTDNGQTWSTPRNLSLEFLTTDEILGNDRVHTWPGIAVDNSGGTHAGNIYVVYENNNLGDGADVVFQRSTDAGLTFSSPRRLNSRPGNDRAQWFPWVTVDQSSGRVHVFYYDQGIASSGDLTEVMHTYSDDGGSYWVAPLPLSNRPFKAGWGNDGFQPNLGDYIQGVAQDGDLFAGFAVTARPPLGFVDGLPATSMTVPDVAFRRYTPAVDLENNDGIKPTTLDLQRVSFTDSGGNGFLDPGETARVRMTLRNYVTNPLNAATVLGITATLSTTTPGVVVTQRNSQYPNIRPGGTAINRRDFVLSLLPSFVPGTPIEFRWNVRSADYGTAALLYTQLTGTPVATLLLSENFDGIAPGTLPAGWLAVHGGGPVTVPWTTVNSFCGPSNGAFHANDNVGTSPLERSRFERLFSPVFAVSSDAEYLTVDFDVCYDTEEDPNFGVRAYDGFFLRLADRTVGHPLRSVLAEAFEDEFTTGSLLHYPRHFPRGGGPFYFEDMAAWAGDSNGLQHVRMRLPGVAGTAIQLRFEYTQDPYGTCADLRPQDSCGVFIDNVVVNSVKSEAP